MVEKIHIVYSSDLGYLLPTLVSASSAVLCAKEHPLIIHLVEDRITDGAYADFVDRIMALPAKVPVEIVRHTWCDSRFDKFPRWHNSSLVYARLVFHEMMPEVEWLISVDGDTLWFGDPWEMLSCRDESKLFQMSIDPPDPNGLENPVFKWYEDRGMSVRRDEYFCAGVMLMNLKAIREQGFFKDAMDFLNAYPDPPLCEQMVICERAKGRISALPEQWGKFSVYHTDIDVNKVPCLIHYVQDLPWRRIKVVHLISDICLCWHEFAKTVLGIDTLKRIPLKDRVWRRAVYLILKNNQWMLKLMGRRAVYFKNTRGL